MAVTSQRILNITFQGSFDLVLQTSAGANVQSPGSTTVTDLSSGVNTIFPPTGGSLPTGVTIKPPDGNTSLIYLKGDIADIGVALHLTDFTSLGLNSPTAGIILYAQAAITGVRLTWT